MHTFFHRANHCAVMLARSVVARLHLHAVLGPEHLRVLAVSQEVLIVLVKVPQGQLVLFHPQSFKL